MWLSVSGYCAKNEHGDRITPRADANGPPGHSCAPGGTVRTNADYDPDGYFYAIDFPPGTTGSYTLQVFDAPHCQGAGSGADDSGASTAAARRYTFAVRGNDSNEPTQASVLDTRVLAPADCGAYANQWVSFYTFVNPVGTYYLQVSPVIPASTTQQEGQNQFALRLAQPGGFSPCTNNSTIASADVAYIPTCPNVYATSHLGVYANLAGGVGSTPSFYLASVGAEHAGKTMEVELFDVAEGSNFIELLDPNGNPVTFTWEVACKDARYRSEILSGCTTGEAAPGGPGYGPDTSNRLAVSGTGTQPWTQLTQNGLYSNRLLRLSVTLPANYEAQYGANTWWRVRYTKGDAQGDRTTWSVAIR